MPNEERIRRLASDQRRANFRCDGRSGQAVKRLFLTGEELGIKGLDALRKDGPDQKHLQIGDLNVGVAVAERIVGARILLDQIKAGRKDIHFIEVMTCQADASTAAVSLSGQIFRRYKTYADALQDRPDGRASGEP